MKPNDFQKCHAGRKKGWVWITRRRPSSIAFFLVTTVFLTKLGGLCCPRSLSVVYNFFKRYKFSVKKVYWNVWPSKSSNSQLVLVYKILKNLQREFWTILAKEPLWIAVKTIFGRILSDDSERLIEQKKTCFQTEQETLLKKLNDLKSNFKLAPERNFKPNSNINETNPRLNWKIDPQKVFSTIDHFICLIPVGCSRISKPISIVVEFFLL